MKTTIDNLFKVALLTILCTIAVSLFMLIEKNKNQSDAFGFGNTSLLSHTATIADATATIADNTLSFRTLTMVMTHVFGKLDEIAKTLSEELPEISESLDYVIPDETTRQERILIRIMTEKAKARNLENFNKMMNEEVEKYKAANKPNE
jgi:hypothetical protein